MVARPVLAVGPVAQPAVALRALGQRALALEALALGELALGELALGARVAIRRMGGQLQLRTCPVSPVQRASGR